MMKSFRTLLESEIPLTILRKRTHEILEKHGHKENDVHTDFSEPEHHQQRVFTKDAGGVDQIFTQDLGKISQKQWEPVHKDLTEIGWQHQPILSMNKQDPDGFHTESHDVYLHKNHKEVAIIHRRKCNYNDLELHHTTYFRHA